MVYPSNPANLDVEFWNDVTTSGLNQGSLLSPLLFLEKLALDIQKNYTILMGWH